MKKYGPSRSEIWTMSGFGFANCCDCRKTDRMKTVSVVGNDQVPILLMMRVPFSQVRAPTATIFDFTFRSHRKSKLWALGLFLSLHSTVIHFLLSWFTAFFQEAAQTNQKWFRQLLSKLSMVVIWLVCLWSDLWFFSVPIISFRSAWRYTSFNIWRRCIPKTSQWSCETFAIAIMQREIRIASFC